MEAAVEDVAGLVEEAAEAVQELAEGMEEAAAEEGLVVCAVRAAPSSGVAPNGMTGVAVDLVEVADAMSVLVARMRAVLPVASVAVVVEAWAAVVVPWAVAAVDAAVEVAEARPRGE